MEHYTDILIAGAGPAGLAAACVLGAEGHRVTLVDPAPPITGEAEPGADLRTTALLQPARDLLDRAGAWASLAPNGTDLWTMRIVDAAGPTPVTRDFEARDVGDAPFGWNFPNWALRAGLLARAEALDTVTLSFGVSVTGMVRRTSGARVALSDGTRVAAGLVIACDGRGSPVRSMAGIGAKRIDYGQTAIVFAVAHALAHDNISTEVHRAGGPFTLVPLPDRDGRHRSAVVWMDDTQAQTARMSLDDTAFEGVADERSAGVMGELAVLSERVAWPITSIYADRFTARRLALLGEAAHGMPPIGAQGLNTSLKDIEVLRDLCASGDLGSDRMLEAYARARRADVAVRMAGIDLLNRTSIAGMGSIQSLRAKGIAGLHDAPFLRRGVMRLGLGVS